MARRPKVDPLDFSRNRPSWAEELRVKNKNATAEVDAVIAKLVEEGNTVTEQQRRAAIVAKENGRDFDFQFPVDEPAAPVRATKSSVEPEGDSSIAGLMTNLPAALGTGLADYFMSNRRAAQASQKLDEITADEQGSGIIKRLVRDVVGTDVSVNPLENTENVLRLISPGYRKVRLEEEQKTRAAEKAEALRVIEEEKVRSKSLEERLGGGLAARTARVLGGVSAQALEQAAPIVGGIVGGVPGAAVGSLPMANAAYDASYREALEQFGATDDEATDYARAMTAVEFGTEAAGGKLAAGAIGKLGITKLTKGAVQEALARKVKGRVGRVAGATVAEGLEEVGAEATGDVVRAGMEAAGTLSSEESRAKLKKFNAEQTATRLDRYLDSAIGGSAAGGIIAAPAAQLSYATELGKQQAETQKAAEAGYLSTVEGAKKQEAEDLKADTELNEDIRLEQERIQQEQAKADAFTKAEQDRAKAEEEQARQKEVEEEAAFRTIETEDKFRGKTRVERAGDTLVERVPINPPAETTPAQVQAEREQAATAEAERVDRVELGGLTEQLRKRQDSLATKTAEEQAKADKKAKGAETRRRRVIMDQLIQENPDKDPADLAPLLRERLKAAPTPAEKAAPAAKPAATPAGTQPATALPEATKPDKDLQDSDVDELTEGLAKLGTLNTVGTTPAADTRKQVKDFKPKLARFIKSVVQRNTNESADVQNLLRQGKMVVAPNPEAIGNDPEDHTGAASYDPKTGKMYVYLDRVDVDDSVGAIAKALHESTHAGQHNDREGRPSILKQMMSNAKYDATEKLIRDNYGKNALATAAVDAARADTKARDGDDSVEHLEVVPYFVTAAAEARQGFGRMGSTVRDIKAAARGFMRDKLGADLDISLAEIASAAQKVAGEIVKTDVQPALPERAGSGTLNIIGGRNATGFDAAREAGDTFTEEADAKERFEIPDFQAELVDSFTPEGAAAYRNLLDGQTLSLENFLSHDALFENYPTLKGLKLKVAPLESYAQYTARDRTVTLNRNQVVEALDSGNDDFLRNLVLHETQHAVQDIEGFSSGANKSEFMPRGIVNSFHDTKSAWNHAIEQFDVDRAIAELPFDIRKAWDLYTKFAGYTTHNEKAVGFMTNQEFINNTKSPILKQRAQTYYNATENYDKAVVKYNEAQDKAFTKYLSDLGEAEARNTEQRSRMTPAQIKARPARDTLLQDPQSKEKNLTRSDLTARVGGQRRGTAQSVSKFPNQRQNRSAQELEAQEDQLRLEFFSRKSLDEVTPEEWAKLDQLQGERIRAQLSEKRDASVNTHKPVFEDMMKIPVGTRIMATHGSKYEEPTLAIVTGSRSLRSDDGWYMLPVVQFEGDNKTRTVLPSGIKEVLAPRKVPKTLNTAGTNSPAFKTWFGDSVAVNPDGSPKTFYTGTSKDKEFTGFRVPKNGVWFTDDPKVASQYAVENDSMSAVYENGRFRDVNTKSRVFPVHLKAENPYVITDADADAISRGRNGNYKQNQAIFFSKLRAQGHDSVIWDGTVENPKVLVILEDPSQIKSVNNTGKYSKKPDVLNTAGTTSKSNAWETSRVREILLRTFSASLGAGKQVQELMEHANSAPSKDRMMAEGSLAKYHNALDFEAARRNMTATELNNQIGTEIEVATQDTTGYKANKAAFDSVVDKYGSTGQHLKNLRDQIDTLTREIVRQRIAQGNPLTKKEENLYNKMLANLGKYNHRQYATNLRDVGDKFSKAVWDAYSKGKNKSRADKENFNRVANAVDWLINHELVIPDDLAAASDEQIRNLHGTWVGGPNAGDKTAAQKREELEAVRDDVNNNPERIKNQAERIVQEILGIVSDPGVVATYFRGGKRDNTIIKQRENIPSPLRELMGEIKDVGATLMVTAAKQAEFIARTNMFMELTKVDDGTVAPPSAVGTADAEGKVKLEGETYGPMEGWYVVPDLKLMLDDAVAELATFEQAAALAVKNPRWFRNAVLTNVADKWAAVAGISKALQIIVQPFNFVYNYAGAYGMMMINGNASPSAWMKGHKAIVDVVANALSPAYSSKILTELNQYGVTDSAFVGDLKAEQYQQLARVAKDMAGLSPKQAASFLGKVKIGGKELYAMMDVWSKAANFYHQVDLLTDFYKAEGVPRTDAAIRREAADITNRTNLTYKRAAPIVRGIEAGGGTAYGVYFYEVFRTQVNNVLQGFTELLRANEANTYKGRLLMGSQAVKRLGGQTAFWLSAGYIARTAAEMVFGGEDEEDKRSLLAEWMQDQDFLPVGYDENGNMTLFQWSRVDPIGPITDLMRAVINKDADLKEVGKKMFDLYVAPRLVPQIVTAVKAIASDTAKVNKDPTLKLVAPDAWSEMIRALSLNGTFRNEKEVQGLWNVVEAFAPGFVGSWRDTNARPAGKDPASEVLNVLTYAGLNLYKMDAKSAARDQARKSKDQIKSARDELTLFFDNHPDATPKEVASLISKLEADEQKAFEDLSSVYRGAKAIGMPEDEITSTFIAAGVSRKQLAAVRNSKFQPTVVSKKSFESHKARELADAETEKDKEKVEAEWDKIGQIVEVSQKSLEEEE
jgi:hypothetical protein